jgi:DNA-binding MarR family transcriptional regulator
MASRMAERMGDLGDRARERMTETRLDKMDRENDRLKHEVRLLREDLREERGSLTRALDALARDEHVTVETKAPKRRGRIIRTLVIGGGAYLLGTRAGRERYDQIVEKLRTMKTSVQDPQRSSDDQAPWQASNPDSAARTAIDPSDTTTTA